MTNPEILVEQLLEAGGMLGPFTDYRGNEQPAPIIQRYEFREQDLGDNRGIFIRQIGDSSIEPHLLQQKTILVGFVTLPNQRDMPIGKNRAEDIYDYLLDNFRQCEMHGLVPLGVNGPYKMDSGRYACEITCNVLIGRASV